MFSDQEYYYAWTYYLVGAAICTACWWVLTAKIKIPELRMLLRTVLIVSLLTPWYTTGTSGYLSPAIVVTFVEGLFDDNHSFARAGMPLLTAVTASVILSLVYHLVRWFLHKRKNEQASASEGQEESHSV